MDLDEQGISGDETRSGLEEDQDSDEEGNGHKGQRDTLTSAHTIICFSSRPVTLPKPQGRKDTASARDEELKKLLQPTILRQQKAMDIIPLQSPKSPTPNLGLSENDIARFHTDRNAPDVLIFARVRGDAALWDPSHPVLDRKCAAQSSTVISNELFEESNLQRVEYDSDDVDTVMIARYVACISPTLRADGLPTHDLVEVAVQGQRESQCMSIDWSMDTLKALYRFAWYMGTLDVCDMVMDQMHQEFDRGYEGGFSVKEIDPVFLNDLVAEGDSCGVKVLCGYVDSGSSNRGPRIGRTRYEVLERCD